MTILDSTITNTLDHFRTRCAVFDACRVVSRAIKNSADRLHRFDRPNPTGGPVLPTGRDTHVLFGACLATCCGFCFGCHSRTQNHVDRDRHPDCSGAFRHHLSMRARRRFVARMQAHPRPTASVSSFHTRVRTRPLRPHFLVTVSCRRLHRPLARSVWPKSHRCLQAGHTDAPNGNPFVN